MTSPDPAVNPAHVGSLCVGCAHRQTIVSGRGSVFLLCRLGTTDAAWPKYPPQPVRRCERFEPADAAKADPAQTDPDRLPGS